MAAETEKAKRFAEVQVELGLDRTMISSMARPERIEHPAIGAGFDESRLARAIEHAGTICRVLQAEGLRPLHHSHIGGVFETEYRDHPAAGRPRPGRDRPRRRHRAPELGRRGPGGVHP